MSILRIKNENGQWVEIPAIKGTNGYTPIKGVDYWTTSDKQEISNTVANSTELNATIDDKIQKAVPTKTSQLENDGNPNGAGTPYIDHSELVAALGELESSLSAIIGSVSSQIPTLTSQLTNDSGFATGGDINDYVNERASYDFEQAFEHGVEDFVLTTPKTVKEYVDKVTGDIETALDAIIALQNTILGEDE